LIIIGGGRGKFGYGIHSAHKKRGMEGPERACEAGDFEKGEGVERKGNASTTSGRGNWGGVP